MVLDLLAYQTDGDQIDDKKFKVFRNKLIETI